MGGHSRAIPATPEALEKVLEHRPVLWVGAGASIAAGHPSTDRLVSAMVAEADDPIDSALSFERVADAFVDSMGAGALEDLLQRELGGSHGLTELHRAIARRAGDGGFAAVVTTNFDDLLERALGDAEVRFVFQSLEENEVVDDPEADLRLLKLHGSRDDWRRVILSGESYAAFGERYPFLGQQLELLLRRQRVLFVGCSLQDPRLTRWLEGLDAAALRRLKPWRALVTRSEWEAALERCEILGRVKTLRPLLLDDHEHLGRLWREVAPPVRSASELTLEVEVGAGGLRARMDGEEARLVEAELGTLEDLAETMERHRSPVVHFSRPRPAGVGALRG